MSKDQEPNYYAVIPANVRYSQISSSAKLLYGEISALANTSGSCWATNDYFSRIYQVRKEAVSRWVSELEQAGFIRTSIDREIGNKRWIFITDPIAKKGDRSSEKTQFVYKEGNNKINSSAQKQEELLKIVNEILGRNFRTLPSRNVTKLLNAFSLVEIRFALTALRADDWHLDKIKTLSIDYFIRPTTIDKFLEISKSQPHNGPTAEDIAEFEHQEEINRRFREGES